MMNVILDPMYPKGFAPCRRPPAIIFLGLAAFCSRTNSSLGPLSCLDDHLLSDLWLVLSSIRLGLSHPWLELSDLWLCHSDPGLEVPDRWLGRSDPWLGLSDLWLGLPDLCLGLPDLWLGCPDPWLGLSDHIYAVYTAYHAYAWGIPGDVHMPR